MFMFKKKYKICPQGDITIELQYHKCMLMLISEVSLKKLSKLCHRYPWSPISLAHIIRYLVKSYRLYF